MAVFSAAGDSLRAAKAALSTSSTLGLAARAGVHAGEVLTTAVVEGIVEGSELCFEDRGDAELKGSGRRFDQSGSPPTGEFRVSSLM